jgi:hypothetical protein
MNQTDRSPHPDPTTLRHFALGRLGNAAMRRVERHVRDCDVCLQVALTAPDDRLLGLLRRPAPSGRIQLVLMGLIVAGISMLSGCGPSGVGSVDWKDNPNARAVGAPPPRPQKPAQPSRRTPPKKTPDFIPG